MFLRVCAGRSDHMSQEALTSKMKPHCINSYHRLSRFHSKLPSFPPASLPTVSICSPKQFIEVVRNPAVPKRTYLTVMPAEKSSL